MMAPDELMAVAAQIKQGKPQQGSPVQLKAFLAVCLQIDLEPRRLLRLGGFGLSLRAATASKRSLMRDVSQCTALSSSSPRGRTISRIATSPPNTIMR